MIKYIMLNTFTIEQIQNICKESLIPFDKNTKKYKMIKRIQKKNSCKKINAIININKRILIKKILSKMKIIYSLKNEQLFILLNDEIKILKKTHSVKIDIFIPHKQKYSLDILSDFFYEHFEHLHGGFLFDFENILRFLIK
jgi:hypothetical protein